MYKIKNLQAIDTKKDFHQISNSVTLFINEMNKKARQLGLMNTLYNNPHGLSNKLNLSSA